jgi:hypothetical protein
MMFHEQENLASVLQRIEQSYNLVYDHVYLSNADGNANVDNEIVQFGRLMSTFRDDNDSAHPLWFSGNNRTLQLMVAGLGGTGSVTASLTGSNGSGIHL